MSQTAGNHQHVPHGAGHDAELKHAMAKVERWRQVQVGLLNRFTDDVNHPQTALFGLAEANMTDAKGLLSALNAEVVRLQKLEALVNAPDFRQRKPEEQEKLGRGIETTMSVSKKWTSEIGASIADANREMSGLNAGAAQLGMDVTKFITEEAPQLMGAIVKGITKNELAGDLTENGMKILLRGVSGLSNTAIHGDEATLNKELGTMEDVSTEACIDSIVSALHVGGESAGVKEALEKGLKNVFAETVGGAAKAAAACKGDAKEKHKAALEGAESGFTDGCKKLITGNKWCEEHGVGQALLEPILTVVKGMLENIAQGKPFQEHLKENAKKGMQKGAAGLAGGRLTRGTHGSHGHGEEGESHTASHKGTPGEEGHSTAHHAHDEDSSHAPVTHHKLDKITESHEGAQHRAKSRHAPAGDDEGGAAHGKGPATEVHHHWVKRHIGLDMHAKDAR